MWSWSFLDVNYGALGRMLINEENYRQFTAGYRLHQQNEREATKLVVESLKIYKQADFFIFVSS